jgi:penicillin amidase
MNWIKAFVALLSLLLLVIILNSRMDVVPALGPFMSPMHGFWQSAQPQHEPHQLWLTPGSHSVQDSVQVVYDERRVPHIFAQNDDDLYFAQGYVTARDRLWQMDLQVRSAGGRLSEVFGVQTINIDKNQRREGMVFGAENKLAAYRENPEQMQVLQSYSDGVNAWIGQLSAKDYPLEYKLFGHEPEPWQPLHTLLMHMNMANTLASGTSALRLSRVRADFGESFIDRFLPAYHEYVDPIVPESRNWPFNPLRVGPPESEEEDFSPTILSDARFRLPNPILGSNSWAVSGSLTKSGAPLLANDMHLDITLPSIWYEVQLHAPDINTYGVSIPGIPFVIVGFNEHIGWGVTNSGANVLDVFEIEFRDETLAEYRYDGGWRETSMKLETIEVKDAAAQIDTVWYTHHGPLQNIDREKLSGYATHWMAHRGSVDMRAFYKLNRATGYEAFVDAIQHFEVPAQNFTYADKDGTISIWNNGRYPVRWEGMGDYISDGSDPTYEWQEFIPHAHLPYSTNPERGFVSSANQHPVTPDYPYYLGRFFGGYERGARINEVLRDANEVDEVFMAGLQLDNLSLRAREALPTLLRVMESDENVMDTRRNDLLDSLSVWNYDMLGDRWEPSLFTEWWRQIKLNLLKAVYGEDYRRYRYPEDSRLIRLLQDEQEYEQLMQEFAAGEAVSRNSLISNSWNAALERMEENISENEQDWQLWRYQRNRVMHLSQVEPLSRIGIRTDGAPEAVNSKRGANGPSWRMVVSLEDEVKAWGVYPGGQSGSPGSRHYDDFIQPWADGQLFPLHLFRSADEAESWIQSQSESAGAGSLLQGISTSADD